MGHAAPTTSRRALLGALTAAPVAALAVPSPWGEALASLYADYGDDPTAITRTKEGRALSRRRYHVAEGFFPAERERTGWHGYLYRAGITAQLALSSHLLDMGFADDWCARHIGLRVAKSLSYANATGLGHDCPDMARLAAILTPYCRWNQVRLFGEPEPDDGGLTLSQIHALLRALLDRVHDVTGHPRPRGWRS
ncbi:hypothetical protein L6Q21_13435 [Sandaracinobacter sp. RS1-74]|uniref:hypothetical protein n=1 Tax=Sandaracinobacteroides sayramensis TaxID=2913411 RepID=UPI001EDA7458|nr:hypothetical protein [Sandaracinobacteroides sayramensis]MCG2841985.1 hypothetical protein [Sandaracinobacteroides sayramensis]